MQTYRTIVVGTDFSDSSSRGVAMALALADRCDAAQVILTHIVPSNRVKDEQEQNDPAVKEALARLEALPRPDKLKAKVQCEVRVGSPARVLSQMADAIHADLVVVGSRGHSGLASLVMGSVARSLTQAVHCPVLVASGDAELPERFERVLAALDLSDISKLVLEHAQAVAASGDGSVRLLSLCESHFLGSEPNERMEDIDRHQHAINQLLATSGGHGVPLDIDVHHASNVGSGIIEAAKQGADLVVIGTSGKNAWHRMILGSTTQHVLSRSPCPVLAVPPLAREKIRDRHDFRQPAAVLADDGLESV